MCTLGCNCFWLIRAQYLEIAVRMGGGCSKTSRYGPADVMDVIVAMRIKPTNEDVQLRGCEALANLAMNAENQGPMDGPRSSIAQAGGIEVVVA